MRISCLKHAGCLLHQPQPFAPQIRVANYVSSCWVKKKKCLWSSSTISLLNAWMSVDSGSTLGGPRETFLVTFQATVEECQWLEELFSLPAASPGCFAQCWWINFPFSSSILIFVSWGWFFTNSFSCVSWQSLILPTNDKQINEH